MPKILVSALDFKGDVAIRPVESTSRKFKTVFPLTYSLILHTADKSEKSGFTYNIDTIEIPEGFQFDGTSSPRFLWPLFPPLTNNEIPAVILHDYLYEKGEPARKFADKAFLAFLHFRGVSRTRARLMYLAVRAFGYKKWST